MTKKRLSNRKKLDRFDKYSIVKLNNLRNSFLKLSKKFKRIVKIDANNNINKEIIKTSNKNPLKFQIIIGFNNDLVLFLKLYKKKYSKYNIIPRAGRYRQIYFYFAFNQLNYTKNNSIDLENNLNSNQNILILKKDNIKEYKFEDIKKIISFVN